MSVKLPRSISDGSPGSPGRYNVSMPQLPLNSGRQPTPIVSLVSNPSPYTLPTVGTGKSETPISLLSMNMRVTEQHSPTVTQQSPGFPHVPSGKSVAAEQELLNLLQTTSDNRLKLNWHLHSAIQCADQIYSLFGTPDALDTKTNGLALWRRPDSPWPLITISDLEDEVITIKMKLGMGHIPSEVSVDDQVWVEPRGLVVVRTPSYQKALVLLTVLKMMQAGKASQALRLKPFLERSELTRTMQDYLFN